VAVVPRTHGAACSNCASGTVPIFYKFEPLENEELKRRLIILSERAGTRRARRLQVHLSEKSKKANARSPASAQPADHPCRHLARQLFR